MKNVSLLLFIFLLPLALFAAPVPYSGKVAINGVNFQGDAKFTFALRDANGTVHWRNGADANASVTLNVDRGLYVTLLGGNGMNDFPPNLFLDHPELYLQVHFYRPDTQEWLHLAPDQRLTSVPHALAADVADWAAKAYKATIVVPGAITRSMLSAEVLADLNATVVLPEQNATIQTESITRSMLAPGVLSDLNRSVVITRNMLPASVLADLNRTLSRTDLPADVLADLNRTIVITRDMLPGDVLADLNATISRSRLSSDVLADLNHTIDAASITLDKLSPQILADLNGTIARSRLPADVLADLNRTVTKSMLSQDILLDLNRTDSNATIAPGSITKSMLAAEVLADLNATSHSDANVSSPGAVPAGSLVAVPASNPAPAGYTLHQAGQLKNLVWEEKANCSIARHAGDGLEALDGKLYFVGGWNDSGSQNLTERYDPATNQWQTLAPMSVARTGVAAAVLNGKLYAIGGLGVSSVEIFDPSSGQWSAGPALPAALAYATAIAVDGKILLVGGSNAPSQSTNQVLELDLGTNQWTQKADMPTARHGMKLVMFDEKVWAIGGGSTVTASQAVESYDPATNSWSSEPSLSTGRKWPFAWVANGVIFVAGGYDPYLATVEVFDPISNQWTSAASLPESKGVSDAVVLGGKVYVVAGQYASGAYSNKLHAADLNATIAGVFDLYRRDGNASSVGSGGTATIAAGSITTNQLNESILKYLRPDITTSPQAPGLVFGGQSVTLSGAAEGKYLTYQWNRNGQPIAGATGATLVIADVNGTLHDGNYTLVVSNDFGSVTSSPTSLQVDGTPTNHTVASIGMQMIFCPPGTFMMGQDGFAAPVHQVTLTNGFYLGKYELTQAQYETVMNGNSEGLNAKPSQWPNNDDRPVEKVSWNDAQVFLSRLNSIEQTAGRLPNGWSYVLPTEAEWEYACRAGTSTAYSWGATIATTNANYSSSGISQTRDVGQYAANPWGFFDMHGNVWEWTADRYQAAYPSGNVTDPTGPASGSNWVSRGGSWNHPAPHLRSAMRNAKTPGIQGGGLGIRVGFKAISADEANPELELFGGAGITREAGQPWVEPGVEAHDVRDGNLTASVTVTGTVDVNSTGSYVLTYTVADAAGNEVNATRTVTVSGSRSVDLNATVALEMVWVPAGAFTMGSPTSEADRQSDREDEHNVSLTKGFYLGKYEVTQAQYEAVMTGNTDSLSATPSQWPNNPNRPVEKVSWADAQIFLTRLNAQQSANIPAGWAYVLPTESQWEYASRAGTTTMYSWGNDINATRANYSVSGLSQTRDVGQYAANPWGFFDMHGNVWEWTADWYQAAYPTGNPVVDPTGPASGSDKVRRGGSWGNDWTLLRSAKRSYSTPSYRIGSIGFRVGFQAGQ